MSLKHDSPFTLDTLYKIMCKGVTWSLIDRAGRHGVPVCPLQVPVVPLLAVQSPGGGGGLHSINLSLQCTVENSGVSHGLPNQVCYCGV